MQKLMFVFTQKKIKSSYHKINPGTDEENVILNAFKLFDENGSGLLNSKAWVLLNNLFYHHSLYCLHPNSFSLFINKYKLLIQSPFVWMKIWIKSPVNENDVHLMLFFIESIIINFFIFNL